MLISCSNRITPCEGLLAHYDPADHGSVRRLCGGIWRAARGRRGQEPGAAKPSERASPDVLRRLDLMLAQTVFDAKRLIGRKFDDKDVQRDMKHYPCVLLWIVKPR